MAEIYDVAIIGGGVIGAAAAYRLAHNDVRTVLLEKEQDVCFGVSKANSGIVHGGFHYSAETTLKGKLELKGNLMFDQLSKDLGFPFERCGILVAAFAADQLETVKKLYSCGKSNGVPGIELCSADRMKKLEPKLDPSVCGGLYAPGGGVVEPYVFVFKMVEAARLNGVQVMTGFHVTEATEHGTHWQISSADGRTVQAKYAINAAGLYADEISKLFRAEDFKISPRKGEEYLLDRLSAARPSKVIFPVPTGHSKGVLVIPTAGGTTMIGPTAQIVEDKVDTSTTEQNKEAIFALAKGMVSGVSERDLITSFSGSRPVIEGKEDFYIAQSEKAPRFIQAAGIQSPGLTSSPSIAEMLAGLLQEAGLNLPPKKEFHLPEIRAKIREITPEQADSLHAEDPAWTNIICRCEKVSEAEIRAAIRNGHTTLDGIKLATRAGMGRCQSGFCTMKILHILAEETGLAPEEILKRDKGSGLIMGRLGGKEMEK